MTNQASQQNNGHNAQAPIAPAPTDVEPPKAAAPLSYSAEFIFETAEGFHVLMRGNELTPRDAMVWAKAASKELASQGFKPVRRDVIVNLPPAAAAPAAASRPAPGANGAEWIKGEGGKPPKCSLHGAGKWLEGEYKAGHAKAGQHFEFWACQTRDCRPKGNPT